MTHLLKGLSVLGLLLTIGPAVLVFTGDISWDTHATVMVVGAVLWFVSAPFWVEDPDPAAQASSDASG